MWLIGVCDCQSRKEMRANSMIDHIWHLNCAQFFNGMSKTSVLLDYLQKAQHAVSWSITCKLQWLRLKLWLSAFNSTVWITFFSPIIFQVQFQINICLFVCSKMKYLITIIFCLCLISHFTSAIIYHEWVISISITFNLITKRIVKSLNCLKWNMISIMLIICLCFK